MVRGDPETAEKRSNAWLVYVFVPISYIKMEMDEKTCRKSCFSH